jgi:hypothetical protein
MIQVSYQYRNEQKQLINQSKLFTSMKEVIDFLKSLRGMQLADKPLIEEATFV